MGKRINPYKLITLIDGKSQKIDFRLVNDMLIDRKGRGTTICENLGFDCISYRFEERQTYSIHFEAESFSDELKFIVGQSGLFLKLQDDSYSHVEEIIDKYNGFIQLCRLCLFSPVGVAHLTDGDYYINPIEANSEPSKKRIEYLYQDVEWLDSEGEKK